MQLPAVLVETVCLEELQRLLVVNGHITGFLTRRDSLVFVEVAFEFNHALALLTVNPFIGNLTLNESVKDKAIHYLF